MRLRDTIPWQVALALAVGAIAMSHALILLGWHGTPLDVICLALGLAAGNLISRVEWARRRK